MEPLEITLIVLAIAAATSAVWLLLQNGKLRSERDVALARAKELEGTEARLRETFGSLAGDVLKGVSEHVLKVQEERYSAQHASASAELDKRRGAVEALVKPIGDALKKTEEELRKLEHERTSAYAGLVQQVKGIAASNDELRKETGKLSTALGKPNVRGRYGEIQLQRVAELAGMRSYCDFTTQAGVTSSAGKLHKPDMIVRLPNDRVLAIDAKTSTDAYMEAIDAPNEEARRAALARYAAHVVEQVHKLSKKDYWSDFADSPELVVMFIPGDQFIDAALEARPELIELSAQRNIVLASPSTLIGLLRAVYVGWRERNLSESAEELYKLGRELHERSSVVLEHAAAVGVSLDRALDAYNRFVGSVDTRMMPTLRKFEEKGAKSAKQLSELRQLEGAPRLIESTRDEIQPAARSAEVEAS